MNLSTKTATMKNPKTLHDKKREFDWEAIRRRAAASAAAMATDGEASPETLERVWAERAALLARPEAREEEGEHVTVALTRIGREIYGMPVEYVLDVWPAQRITRVPRTPAWVVGVTNLHGRIMLVTDLRLYFDLPAAEKSTEAGDRRYLMVVTSPQMETVLLVDDVIGVESLLVSEEHERSVLLGLPAQYVYQFAERQRGGALTVVLNLKTLFADNRFKINEELS